MNNVFEKIEKALIEQGFNIISKDFNRPWGGFFVMDEEQAQAFANEYFDCMDVAQLRIAGALSPKILVVKPGQRLSWQYHHRRAELWRVVEGKAGIVRSATDTEGPLEVLSQGQQITLQQGERHRLIGLEDWAIVAEIWRHTDADHPSDEEDIVRLQDDYGR